MALGEGPACVTCNHELLLHGSNGCMMKGCTCRIVEQIRPKPRDKYYYIFRANADQVISFKGTKEEAIKEALTLTEKHNFPFMLAANIGFTKKGEPTFEEQS